MERIVTLQSVSAGYNNKPVITDVNFEVYDNDFIGVIGPNGGGKTTLVKVIVGLLKPLSGDVIINQALLSNHHSLIGYLPQISRFDVRFPIIVHDVVLSGMMSKKGAHRRFTRNDHRFADEILEKAGVADLRNKSIGELSGGQLQRVLLCRAMIGSPRLLILDEPNTFVDSKFEQDLYSTLKELNKSTAIIVVSHDVGTISYFVKTIACVNRYLNHHRSNIITEEQLASYGCPLQLITHGDIPHTVLRKHTH
ncbi:MAG TPA: ABC transporter ATP-binding protein [Bacteroidales bacterium]|nr:ABC transporter ATP-binding protein [Bacteroidales bacterium]